MPHEVAPGRGYEHTPGITSGRRALGGATPGHQTGLTFPGMPHHARTGTLWSISPKKDRGGLHYCSVCLLNCFPVHMSCTVAASVDVVPGSLEVASSIPDVCTYANSFSFFPPITDHGWGPIATPWPAWGGGTPGHHPVTSVLRVAFHSDARDLPVPQGD